MRFHVLLALAPFALACGGSTTTDLFADASTDGSSGTDGGSGTDGSPADARPDVSQAQCQKLLADVANLRDKARKCEPNGGSIPCAVLVDDLCCPISVTDPKTQDVQNFVAAVKAATQSGCSIACPAIACPTEPSKVCNGTGRCN